MDKIPTGSIKAIARMQQEMGRLLGWKEQLESRLQDLQKKVAVLEEIVGILDGLRRGPLPDAHAQLLLDPGQTPLEAAGVPAGTPVKAVKARRTFSPTMRRKTAAATAPEEAKAT